MNDRKRRKFIIMLFTLMIALPGLLLVAISLWNVSREEIFIAKQIESALSVEVIQTVTVLKNRLSAAETELSDTLNKVKIEQDSSLLKWKDFSNLVAMPFRLNSDKEIIWPQRGSEFSDEERSFYAWAAGFFRNKAAIPVFQNIAELYKSEIIQQSGKVKPSNSVLSSLKQAKELFSGATEVAPILEEEKQLAISQFNMNAPIREKVYDQAITEGQGIITRTTKSKQDDKANEVSNKSVFVYEPLTFDEIIRDKIFGVIPWFVGDRLYHIFWKRQENGFFTGCLVDEGELRNRMAGSVSVVYTEERIMTILDERGIPLLSPGDDIDRDWKTPFIANEISELLPRWEVAAYLTDPGVVASRARVFQTAMWILIFVLLTTIISGGFVVVMAVNNEIRLAQQKTTFVANVSHELKTPLTSIRMFSEMLEEGRQSDEEKRKKYLHLIVTESERLSRLIDNVLDFSRTEQGKRRYHIRRFDVNTLCIDIVESRRIELEAKGFTVKSDISGDRLYVDIDDEAIKQVLLNLLSNAEKYSVDKKEILIRTYRDGMVAVVEIQDKGIGISVGDVKRLFQPFFRVDDSLSSPVSGTGLGLTIAKRIALDLGGDVVYKSPASGEGSIFQLRLSMYPKEVK